MTIDVKYGRDHIWHQYSSSTNPIKTYPIFKVKGVMLTLEDWQ